MLLLFRLFSRTKKTFLSITYFFSDENTRRYFNKGEKCKQAKNVRACGVCQNHDSFSQPNVIWNIIVTKSSIHSPSLKVNKIINMIFIYYAFHTV